MSGTDKSKRRKSGGGDAGPQQKRQTTLLSAFQKIDRAIASQSNPTAAATSSRGPALGSSHFLIDLTTSDTAPRAPLQAASQPKASSAHTNKPTSSTGKAVSNVSDSYIEFNQPASRPATSLTHVSDSYRPKSLQGSHKVHTVDDGAMSSRSADEASSPQLCAEQAHVMELVDQGKNVFFTGNAGTGKTFLLNHIIAQLRRKYGKDFATKVALAAPTGIAATHIQGTTLNAALGVGVPQSKKDFNVMQKKETRSRIRQWEVLLVDEVSMLSAEFFEIMEAMLRSIRGVGKPAGGLQLIMCGDFFQLPPVTKRWVPGTPLEAFLNWGYAFQAPAWKDAGIDHVLLTKVFRQKDDEFIRILDDVRYGRNTQAALQRLRERCLRPLSVADGIKPTQLYSRNKEVDETNEAELARLAGSPISFGSEDSVQPDPALDSDAGMQREAMSRLQRNEFFRDCLAAPSIRLKVGAQVMLLKNVDLEGGPNASRQLVNGSRGVVVGLLPKQDALKKLEAEREALGGGDNVRMARNLDIKANVKVAALSRQIEMLRGWGGTQVPVVRFRNGAEIEVLPSLFSSSVAHTGECRRVQIPLKLAWALTIHKCQGLTLDLVQVSLKDCFAQGQAYVALSRARSLEGLQILDWDPNCVRTDPAVAAFYAALQRGAGGAALQDGAWERWMAMRSAGQPVGAAAAAASQAGAPRVPFMFGGGAAGGREPQPCDGHVLCVRPGWALGQQLPHQEDRRRRGVLWQPERVLWEPEGAQPGAKPGAKPVAGQVAGAAACLCCVKAQPGRGHCQAGGTARQRTQPGKRAQP